MNVVLANNLHQNHHAHNNLFAGVVYSNFKGQNVSRDELVNKASASVKNDPTNAELHRENKCFKSSALPRSNVSIVQTNDNCLSHKNVWGSDFKYCLDLSGIGERFSCPSDRIKLLGCCSSDNFDLCQSNARQNLNYVSHPSTQSQSILHTRLEQPLRSDCARGGTNVGSKCRVSNDYPSSNNFMLKNRAHNPAA